MSEIFGLVQLDGRPVERDSLSRMALEAGSRSGSAAFVRLGHAALGSSASTGVTAGLSYDPATGCVLAGSLRLDDRATLARELSGKVRPFASPAGLAPVVSLEAPASPDFPPQASDPDLALAAYLTWGSDFPSHLTGEFALALWDPRVRTLHLVRDRLGEQPLFWHCAPGNLLAFASRPAPLLALAEVPCEIREERIADFLAGHRMEGVDRTTSFYRGIDRLAPAHRIESGPGGVKVVRYWSLTPGPELAEASDSAYEEAFLHHFGEAVANRVGMDSWSGGAAGAGAGPRAGAGSGTGSDPSADRRVGVALSGGIDSNAVASLAAESLSHEGRGPLVAISAVGPEPESCPESRAIALAHASGTFDSHTVGYDRLEALLPRLETQLREAEDPFDNQMTLPRAVYLAARDEGISAVLDGGGGDLVLSGTTRLPRLLRSGRLGEALREARALDQFWGGAFPARGQLSIALRTAFLPERLRMAWRRARQSKDVASLAAEGLLAPEFAARIDLGERLRRYRGNAPPGALAATPGEDAARLIQSPDFLAGIERYHRVAAQAGIAPSDPFRDIRFIEFAVRLPLDQKQRDGWPKWILRRAMNGRVPDAIRWRRGKEHLGWDFTSALLGHMGTRLQDTFEDRAVELGRYVALDRVRGAWKAYHEEGDMDGVARVLHAASVASWLKHHGGRPPLPEASGVTLREWVPDGAGVER